jgi:toxin ParE1/3/4
MTRIVITESASLDEISILHDLHLKAGFSTALKFSVFFRDLYERLSIHPKSGAPRPLLGKSVRISIVSPYIVIYDYEEKDDRLTILRVVHGHRRLSGMLLRKT